MIETFTEHPPCVYVQLAEKLERLLQKRQWALLDCYQQPYIEAASEPTTDQIAKLLEDLLNP